MEQSSPRPPYVTFETRALERRGPAGEIVYEDKDFACVTPIGSKDIIEREVKGWFSYLDMQVDAKRMPQEWLMHFRRQYEAFKADKEPPLEGLSVKNWPAATKSEAARLWLANVKTVEDLAQANEGALQTLGMGARALKQKAVDWLAGAQGVAPLVVQLEALRKTNESLQIRLESLEKQNQMLAARAAPVPATFVDEKSSVDEIVDAVLK